MGNTTTRLYLLLTLDLPSGCQSPVRFECSFHGTVGRDLEPEHEHEDGKEARSRINHCIGMRKEEKDLGTLLEEFDPQNCCVSLHFSNIPSAFQTDKKESLLLCRTSLSHTSLFADEIINTWAAFSGRDHMQTPHIGKARYRVRRHHN